MSSENKPIKVGLCAYGMSGRVFHAPFLDILPEYELSAVVERHQKTINKRYPKVKSYSSVDDLLADKALELIVVNTPNTTHFEFAKKALLAQKDVVVEKPFATTTEEAKALVELAEQVGQSLIVFQNRRWDSDFLALKKVVEEKFLGDLIDAEFHYDRYRMELSQKPHKEQKQPGVGLLFDLGPHLIDQAIHLFGKPKSVFARIQAHRIGSEIDDYFSIQLLYDNFNCTLKSSLLVREPLPAFQLHGTLGSFIKSRSDVQEELLKKEARFVLEDWGSESENEGGILHIEKEGKSLYQRIQSPRGQYQEFYRQVYKWLKGKGATPVSLEDSLLVMQILEASDKSERTGSIIQL